MNNIGSYGKKLWSVTTSTPLSLPVLCVEFGALWVMAELINAFLNDLVGVVMFYTGTTSTISFTPRGLFGGPALALIAPVIGVGVLLASLATVHQYLATQKTTQVSYNASIRTVIAHKAEIAKYLSIYASLLMIYFLFEPEKFGIGKVLIASIIVYVGSQLLPGIAIILRDGLSARRALVESLELTGHYHLAVPFWAAVVIIVGSVLSEVVAIWVAIPPVLTALAAISATSTGE